jgi:hypothetical protein
MPDGSLKETPYDFIKYRRFRSFAWRSHEQAAEQLKALVFQRESMMIMGRAIIDDPNRRQRRLWANSAEATLECGPRRWFAADFDDEPVPEPLGRPKLFAQASVWLRDHRLPEEFHSRRMVAIPSAKTGLKGDKLFRGKLLVALDKAHAIGNLKSWAKGLATATDLKIDSAVIQIGQPIYIARPLFIGMRDPVPRELHSVILPGETDVVSLDAHRFDEAVRLVNTKVERALADCGDDWRSLMDRTVGGGPGACFVPITRGLGVAARSADDEATIVNFVVTLVAERADKDRRQAYGSDWIVRTLRRFRDRDQEGHLAIVQLRKQLFFGGGDGR